MTILLRADTAESGDASVSNAMTILLRADNAESGDASVSSALSQPRRHSRRPAASAARPTCSMSA